MDRIFSIFFSFPLIAVLVGLNVMVVATSPSVSFNQQLAFRVTPPSISLTKVREITHQSRQVFLTGSAALKHISEGEASHLLDTHRVFHRFMDLSVTAAVFCFSISAYALFTKTVFPIKSLYTILLMFSGLLIVCLVLFPFFFTLFHGLLFPQGNWMFPPTSSLIQAFPLPFWFLSLFEISLLFISETALLRLAE